MLLPINWLYSQIVLEKDSDCFLKNELQLKRQLDCTHRDEGGSGGTVLWDFSDWKLIKENIVSRYFFTSQNSVSEYEYRTFFDYELKNDTIILCGYKNSTTDISYTVPEILLIYPLNFGDSISQYYYGGGNYCDHFDLKIFGKKEVCVDAYGTIILPSGDTVFNVLRVHSEKKVSEEMTVGKPIKKTEIYIPPIDTIATHFNNSVDWMKIDVFEWYMENHCRPIFKLIKNTVYRSNKPYRYFETAFYSPLEGAYVDGEDAVRLGHVRKKNDSSVYEDIGKKTFLFELYPDDNKNNIVLEYSLVESVDVDVILFDIQGRLLFRDSWKRQPPGFYKIYIDISQYPFCNFIVRLSINEKVYSKKIFIK